MYKLRRTLVAGVFALGLIIGLGAVGQASAQEGGVAGNGIRVSPVRTDITIKPGESKTLKLSVQNITNTTADFQGIINDFVPQGELGQPALILDADKYAPSHSLKRYISPIENVNIPAGQTREVTVSINVPSNAAGGGYYGAVRFTPAGAAGSRNVTLSASVGSLILVKVPGDIVENTTIESFDVRRGEEGVGGSSFFATNKDLYAVVRFNNKGNLHEQPFGRIRVLKAGKVVQETEINNTDPKANVLPDSIRRFNIKLDKIGSFGKYTVEGNFGYGENGQLLSGKTSFWVVPLAAIVGAIALIVLVLALIFVVPRLVKKQDRKSRRKAGRR